jgi:hypothetical protein
MLRFLLALLVLAVPASLRAQDEAVSTPVTITGVVLEHEPRYPPFDPSEQWRAWFKLTAWRSGDGPVQTTQMSVIVTAPTEETIAAVLAQLPEGQLVRFTLVGDVTFDKHRPEATLLEVQPVAEDAALLAAAQRMLNPAPLVDPQFGTFVPAAQRHDVFWQETEWLGQRAEVVLWLDLRRADTHQRTLATLRKAWQGRKRLDRTARKELQQFHDLWRKQYQRPDQPVLARADFAKRLRLVEASAFDNGDVGFRYMLDGFEDFPVMDFNVWNDGTIETDVP